MRELGGNPSGDPSFSTSPHGGPSSGDRRCVWCGQWSPQGPYTYHCPKCGAAWFGQLGGKGIGPKGK